jgi:hypothetical protein
VKKTSPQRWNDAASQLSPGTAQHHTLALKYVLRRLLERRHARVLDLGAAIGPNVSFFGRYAPKLYVSDLYNTLKSRPGGLPKDRKQFERLLSKDLPSDDLGPFDLILAWDLLNYLSSEQMAILGRHLARLCRQDSLIFALITNSKEMPSQPIGFRIIDTDTLSYTIDSDLGRPSPLFKESDLNRWLADFEVETSFLLRNGFQEYVLSFSE